MILFENCSQNFYLSINSDYSRPRKRAGRHEKGAGRKKRIKYLLNGKTLDWSKFKVFAEDKLNVARIMISVSDRVENIVGKGEMLVTSTFSFSHNVFKRLLSKGLCGYTISITCPTKAKILNLLLN